MNRLHSLIAGAALVAAVSAAGLAAQPAGAAQEGKCQFRMHAELNLSAEQQEKLKVLHQEMMQVRQKHMESVKAVRDKIRAELLKADASQNVLYGYAAELGELHKQMSVARADHLLKVKKVLSADQFAKLLDREERMGPGKECCPPDGKCPRHGKAGTLGEGSGCPHMMKGAPPQGKAGGCPHMADNPPQTPAGCPHHMQGVEE